MIDEIEEAIDNKEYHDEKNEKAVRAAHRQEHRRALVEAMEDGETIFDHTYPGIVETTIQRVIKIRYGHDLDHLSAEEIGDAIVSYDKAITGEKSFIEWWES